MRRRTPSTCANGQIRAGSSVRKCPESREGGKPPYNVVYGGSPPASASPPIPLIIGFDSEWAPTADPTVNRLLSYQYAARYEGKAWTGIVYPDADPRAEDKGRGPRLRFADLLATAISEGIKRGFLRVWPKHLIAAAHWTRADLAHMADFAEIKHEFKGVKKTYTSLGRTYKARALVGKHMRKFAVTLVDTQLLVPGAVKKLEKLGELYKFAKFDPGTVEDETGATVDAIGRMDLLLAANRDLYERYAIRDAEICAVHVEAMIRFVRDEMRLGEDVPVTLGALTVQYVLNLWKLHGVDVGAVNGFEVIETTRFNPKTGKFLTKKERIPKHRYLVHERLVKFCFLGGRNECFWYGPTSDMDPTRWPEELERYDLESRRAVMVPMAYREYDLQSAYATALASLGIPDYERARRTNDPRDFRVDQLGFARIRFSFPTSTRFPCIAVKDTDGHGLIFPLNGEAYATAPEIVTALRLGAQIEVIDGVIVPWVENGVKPFELAVRELSTRRARHPRGSLLNEMFKQLGNSIYGKLGQGINPKSYFDTEHDTHEEGGPCAITNPYLAAHVTGLIRALVSELIAGVHPRYTVVSVTTDAFITNAPLSGLDFSGPVARYMSMVRARLITEPESVGARIGADLLEQKYVARQLLPWRNKGVATIKPAVGVDGEELKPKLAQGGMRAAEDAPDQNAWFCRTMLDRRYETTWESREPLPFPLAHQYDADHFFRRRLSRVNFEFDLKRRLVDPSPSFVCAPGDPDRIVQQVSCNTVPWETIEEFQRARKLSDQWHHKQKRQMRTVADYEDWQEYLAGDSAANAGVNRRGGIVRQAHRMFLRAYVMQEWGLPGRDYEGAANALTALGYPTSVQQLKDAKRSKRKLAERAIPAAAPGVRDFVRAILTVWPEFQWWRLLCSAIGTEERDNLSFALGNEAGQGLDRDHQVERLHREDSAVCVSDNGTQRVSRSAPT